MKKLWENNAVIAINLAMYVAPGKGKSHHSRRRYHGLVYNEENSRRDYFFSDEFVLKTGPRDLYYLPKSASYQVKSEGSGGCYAINFDLLSDPELPPFSLSVKQSAAALTAFRQGERAWREGRSDRNLQVQKSILELFLILSREEREEEENAIRILNPAIEYFGASRFRSDCSVDVAASLCRITPAYFRRLFHRVYGEAPKEYLTRLRMEHAAALLESGQFAVAETARECGYAEPCHFSRSFSRYFGISPLRYSREKCGF